MKNLIDYETKSMVILVLLWQVVHSGIRRLKVIKNNTYRNNDPFVRPGLKASFFGNSLIENDVTGHSPTETTLSLSFLTRQEYSVLLSVTVFIEISVLIFQLGRVRKNKTNENFLGTSKYSWSIFCLN